MNDLSAFIRYRRQAPFRAFAKTTAAACLGILLGCSGAANGNTTSASGRATPAGSAIHTAASQARACLHPSGEADASNRQDAGCVSSQAADFAAATSQYADSNLPPAGWQFPYHPNPFVVPVCSADPCSPAVDPSSDSKVSVIMAHGFSLGLIQEAQPGTDGAGQANTFPIYYASNSDPSYQVTCSQYGGCANILPASIHIPDGARASVDGDHHMTVIDLLVPAEYDFWEFNDGGSGHGTTTPVSSGGAVSTGYGGMCLKTSFARAINSCLGGATAADVPPQPGVLDPREILAQQIDHVIFVASPCEPSGFVFPANKTDNNCPGGPTDGQRVWLDLTDAQIEALPQHRWAKTILHQMHHYGFMVTDRSGGGPWDIYGADDSEFTLWGQPSQWGAFFDEAAAEGDAPSFADNSSHLPIPTTGILQSDMHVLSGTPNRPN